MAPVGILGPAASPGFGFRTNQPFVQFVNVLPIVSTVFDAGLDDQPPWMPGQSRNLALLATPFTQIVRNAGIDEQSAWRPSQNRNAALFGSTAAAPFVPGRTQFVAEDSSSYLLPEWRNMALLAVPFRSTFKNTGIDDPQPWLPVLAKNFNLFPIPFKPAYRQFNYEPDTVWTGKATQSGALTVTRTQVTFYGQPGQDKAAQYVPAFEPETIWTGGPQGKNPNLVVSASSTAVISTAWDGGAEDTSPWERPRFTNISLVEVDFLGQADIYAPRPPEEYVWQAKLSKNINLVSVAPPSPFTPATWRYNIEDASAWQQRVTYNQSILSAGTLFYIHQLERPFTSEPEAVQLPRQQRNQALLTPAATSPFIAAQHTFTVDPDPTSQAPRTINLSLINSVKPPTGRAWAWLDEQVAWQQSVRRNHALQTAASAPFAPSPWRSVAEDAPWVSPTRRNQAALATAQFVSPFIAGQHTFTPDPDPTWRRPQTNPNLTARIFGTLFVTESADIVAFIVQTQFGTWIPATKQGEIWTASTKDRETWIPAIKQSETWTEE